MCLPRCRARPSACATGRQAAGPTPGTLVEPVTRPGSSTANRSTAGRRSVAVAAAWTTVSRSSSRRCRARPSGPAPPAILAPRRGPWKIASPSAPRMSQGLSSPPERRSISPSWPSKPGIGGSGRPGRRRPPPTAGRWQRRSSLNPPEAPGDAVRAARAVACEVQCSRADVDQALGWACSRPAASGGVSSAWRRAAAFPGWYPSAVGCGRRFGDGSARPERRAAASRPRDSSILMTASLRPARARSDMITTRARVSGGSCRCAASRRRTPCGRGR